MDSTRNWVRLADPDGWVSVLCPAGHPQLAPPADAEDWHRDNPARELEALDLYIQARVAVHQTYGTGGRLKLPGLFAGWEAEAINLADAANRNLDHWSKIKEKRQLTAKSPFAQGLLSVCHRDVVLEAQHSARLSAALPSQCRRARLPRVG